MLKRILLLNALVLLSGSVLAAPTDGMLATKEGDCHFYYPTHKNTQGWYIQTTPTDMCRNGFVGAHGEVTIYNAFSKPVEQFYGFFNGGYWTGDVALSADVLFRRSEKDGSRKVFFTLPSEAGLDVQYIGQMTAKKQKDNTYGPFSFCDPFRVLVQTTDFELFVNRDQTTELIDEVAKITRNLCPAEKQILLYGATRQDPKMQDIFFYAEIDLQTAQITIKRNDADKRAQNYEKITEDADVKNTADEVSAFAPDKTVVVEPALIPVADKQKTPAVPEIESVPASVPSVVIGDVPGDIITPVPKQTLDASDTQIMDKVPHLLTIARLLKKPIYGTAVVEINRLNEAGGESDRPVKLKLNGVGLQSGWGVVSGDFEYKSGKKTDDLTGVVQVSSFVPCSDSFCKDIK